MKENIVIKIIEILKQAYPDAKCSLNFTTPFEMLIAVMLSAQCTDERVNKTTPSNSLRFIKSLQHNNISSFSTNAR